MSAPLNVLIVEDEALIAMDIEGMVEDCGHTVAGEVASVGELEAARWIGPVNVALVDVRLADESCGIDACAIIRERWPDAVVVFITGNPKLLPDDFAGALGVIPKPFSRNDIVMTMQHLGEALCDPPAVSELPATFRPAPNLGRARRPA